jgi:putative cardiolipin synthase
MVARLNLIRAAQRSIDVQTYIWDQDDAGQLVLNELVQAARRGVRCASWPTSCPRSTTGTAQPPRAGQPESAGAAVQPDLPQAHTSAAAMGRRHCCAASSSSTSACTTSCCWWTTASASPADAITRIATSTGTTSFDYVDRDVLVGGPAARQMADSFELFWQSQALGAADPSARRQPLDRRRIPPHRLAGTEIPHPQRVARAQQEAEDAIGCARMCWRTACRPATSSSSATCRQRPTSRTRKAHANSPAT